MHAQHCMHPLWSHTGRPSSIEMSDTGHARSQVPHPVQPSSARNLLSDRVERNTGAMTNDFVNLRTSVGRRIVPLRAFTLSAIPGSYPAAFDIIARSLARLSLPRPQTAKLFGMHRTYLPSRRTWALSLVNAAPTSLWQVATA